MHNGVFSTLEEVIAFVDRGGGEGSTELKPLGLTDEERAALRAFLVEALTGAELPLEFPKIP
jgi:cytochrome c peroxidase